METQSSQQEAKLNSVVPVPSIDSCRKKKSSDDATFLEDVRDHIDDFIHASINEHKNCFKKGIQKMFGMSKAVEEKKELKEVESVLPLRTTVSEYSQCTIL